MLGGTREKGENMATCKDCLHIDVCYMVEHYGVDMDEERQEYNCHQFKDRTKYVEVVRCKDCKKIAPSVTAIKDSVWCREFRAYMPCDGFCSYGERKNGE